MDQFGLASFYKSCTFVVRFSFFVLSSYLDLFFLPFPLSGEILIVSGYWLSGGERETELLLRRETEKLVGFLCGAGGKPQ